MKIYKKPTSLLILLVFLLVFANCKAEKEKDFFGIGEEELSLILTGLILNRGFVDTQDGNVVDQVNKIVYKKCISGQVYRPAQNDCRGIQRSTLFTPNDVVLFGAQKLGYCSVNSWNCNSRNYPFPLAGSSVTSVGGITIIGVSQAFEYCNAFNTGGAETGWRVANPLELVRLTKGGRNAMLQVFPDTPEDWFWSEWARADDLEGETAIAVSFERGNFGEEKAFDKRFGKYVRCVRPLNPSLD